MSRFSLLVLPLAFSQMIYRNDLINDVATSQLFTTYPLTVGVMQTEWIKWAEYESRKRLDPVVDDYPELD